MISGFKVFNPRSGRWSSFDLIGDAELFYDAVKEKCVGLGLVVMMVTVVKNSAGERWEARLSELVH